MSRTNAGSWNRMLPAGLPPVIVSVTELPLPVMVKLIRCPPVVGRSGRRRSERVEQHLVGVGDPPGVRRGAVAAGRVHAGPRRPGVGEVGALPPGERPALVVRDHPLVTGNALAAIVARRQAPAAVAGVVGGRPVGRWGNRRRCPPAACRPAARGRICRWRRSAGFRRTPADREHAVEDREASAGDENAGGGEQRPEIAFLPVPEGMLRVRRAGAAFQ
jgi:hypothetical protein